MYPRILIDPGRGQPRIELQKSYDEDLQTKNKTVVSAINEIHSQLNRESPINAVSNEFTIVEEGKILQLKEVPLEKVKGLKEELKQIKNEEVDVKRLIQEDGDVMVLNCGSSN